MTTSSERGNHRPLTLELEPAPEFVASRNAIFEHLKQERDGWTAQQPREDIEIKYQRGENKPTRTLVGKSWQTTPASIAKQVSVRSELDRWLVSLVDGQLWDLERPLEKSCVVELLDFDHPQGKKVFWDSSAHILGNAAERRFGCLVNQASTRHDGFMNEWAMPELSNMSTTITKADYKPLHRLSHKIINRAQVFERLEGNKQDLLPMFAYNKYKIDAIQRMEDDQTAVVYRCGEYIDLCEGPLIPDTGRIKAFELVSNSSSYFNGDAANDSLQRIYGVSFPDKKALEEHKKWLEQAALRDHRKIGARQELFFFHSTVSPGSAFFLPRGQVIYNILMAYMREEYWKRGYQEVTTPNMFNSALWKQSGHWQHYKDDMFKFEVEKDEWAMKPMNCPGHCVLFGHRERTYRELPLRISEFGILHRNELSGALTGLTRVRRFVQDDTHIFCMESQIEQEVKNVLDWLTAFYHRIFGFKFKVRLSTMPESHLGDLATWQRAEAQLKKALDMLKNEMGIPWEINPGDGAFYGPKIDITISDALKRDHQCASIQLDFQLPEQFNLEYRTDEQFVKPEQKVTQNRFGKHLKSNNDTNGISTNKSNGHREAIGSSHVNGTKTDLADASGAVEDSTYSNGQKTEDISMGQKDPPVLQTLEEQAEENIKIPNGDGHNSMSELSNTSVSQSSPATEGVTHRRELTPGFSRPVMIHRGLLGSFERFIAILCEHFAGKWPFWLNPRQILIVPVTSIVNDYAVEVQSIFRKHNLRTDVDISRNTLTKKIRTGQLHDYSFIFVVGRKERDCRSVNIRNRDDANTHKRGQMVSIEKASEVLCHLRDERQLSSSVSFT